MPVSPFALLDLALLSAAALLVWRYFISSKSALPRPPGPPGYPIIGNLLDMPATEQPKVFSEYGSKYGPLTYLNVVGQPIIIVNDARVANDLFDKRSTIYSDRPTLRMAGELAGWENVLGFQKYGPSFRAQRKGFSRVLGARAQLKRFYPLFERAGGRMIKDILEAPDKFSDAFRRAAGMIILKIAYGYDVRDGADAFVDLVEEAMTQFSELGIGAGGYLVDYIPFLKYLPEWFPGAGFQRTAKKYRATVTRMANAPMELVEKQVADGTAEPSFVADELNNGKANTAQEKHDLKWAAASMYGGGADTTVCAMQIFTLVMTLFPGAQQKAQVELDAVVGQDRLPTMADRSRLPYLNALHLEVLRWAAVAPLAIPHKLTEDDVYEGAILPKGSILIPNVRYMLRDPTVYKDAHTFYPERFLESPGHAPEQDPRLCVFGFGRRICPGLSLADATTWLKCALVLATMKISKAVDEKGQEITPSVKFLDGTISFPEPFKCSIKPRSAQAEALIRGVD